MSELLAGVLTSEDEDAVEAELDKLISEEHQKAVDKLPTVPSDDLLTTVPGNLQSCTVSSFSRPRGVNNYPTNLKFCRVTH